MVVFDYIYTNTFKTLIKFFNIDTQVNSSGVDDAFEFTPIFVTDLLPSFDVNFGYILNYVYLLLFAFLFLSFFLVQKTMITNKPANSKFRFYKIIEFEC